MGASERHWRASRDWASYFARPAPTLSYPPTYYRVSFERRYRFKRWVLKPVFNCHYIFDRSVL